MIIKIAYKIFNTLILGKSYRHDICKITEFVDAEIRRLLEKAIKKRSIFPHL